MAAGRLSLAERLMQQGIAVGEDARKPLASPAKRALLGVL